MHKDCPVCRAEGFEAHNRVLLKAHGKHIIATLYQVTGNLVDLYVAALSDEAWLRLALKDGDEIAVEHPEPIESLASVRGRIYGNALDGASLRAIIADVADGRYPSIEIGAFLTACAANPLTSEEVLSLTRAMVQVGDHLTWNSDIVVDKHSVGGLPGNRTTPIVVAIAAAVGLTMPKTSSRAITSPAGTADMMETLAPVDLDADAIHRVVEREGGCIVWGGAVRLSPADDILIRVERALDIDTEGQMIASVLSKKVAAGATHLVLDMPVGPTAKVRTNAAATALSQGLLQVAQEFGIKTRVIATDGNQPVGRGIGPALEALDVLAVLKNDPDAPSDLRERSLALSGALLELAHAAEEGSGAALAARVLVEGRAWEKFQRICEAQGGMRIPPVSSERHEIVSRQKGRLHRIDNRKVAKLAKLAGAPEDRAAGIRLHAHLGDSMEIEQPLCTVHAEAPGELSYALAYASSNPDIFEVVEE